jgi:hypothetical protein
MHHYVARLLQHKYNMASIVIGAGKKKRTLGAFSNPASRSRSLAWFRSTLVAACRPYNSDIL